MTWPHGDPSAVVRSVLAGPAFRSVSRATNAQPPATFFEVVWRWAVQHVFGPLFLPLVRAARASHDVGMVAGVVLVVLSLLALGFVAFRLALAFAASHGSADRSPSAGEDALVVRRSAFAWRSLAREAALRGDFAGAIAALFSAALAALDERAFVAFNAARTPDEYRRLVRAARAPAAPGFDDLAERFVRAAYAPEHPVAADFERAERAYAAFEPALGA